MELQQIESQISSSLESFAVAGLALRDIRDGKLWRAGHDTFGQYCVHKWAIEKDRVEWLIAAGTCMDNLYQALGPGKPLPVISDQLRPLLELEDPQEQVDAWREAVANTHGGKPTAEVVEAAVATRQPPHEDEENEMGEEIRKEFFERLDKVREYAGEGHCTLKQLQKLLKCHEVGLLEFISMCEVSPAVTVHYQEKAGKDYYAFERTNCVLGRERVMQLAKFVSQCESLPAAQAAGARIITLLGGG